jgi:hypothetical protein
MGVGGQRHAPAALPPVKTRYPLYRRLGGPQGRPGRVRKISPPPEFDPQTVQPVASRYTDWAIAARNKNDNDNNGGKNVWKCNWQHALGCRYFQHFTTKWISSGIYAVIKTSCVQF